MAARFDGVQDADNLVLNILLRGRVIFAGSVDVRVLFSLFIVVVLYYYFILINTTVFLTVCNVYT